MHAPVIVPPTVLLGWVTRPWFRWLLIGGGLYGVYRYVYRIVGYGYTALVLGAGVFCGFGVFEVHRDLAHWQRTLRPTTTAPYPALSGTKGSLMHTVLVQPSMPSLNGFSPLAKENPWIVAIALVLGAIGLLGYLLYRGLPATVTAKWRQRLLEGKAVPARWSQGHDGAYPISPIELGIHKDTGKPIRIEGKDRFINTAVLGSIGTGKTSRILLKAVYQDLVAMSQGWPMDVIVLEPDGEFAEQTIRQAKAFGIETDIIDLRSGEDEADHPYWESTVSFTPFGGSTLADTIDNVRAALQEKMGKQEGFFQNAQDALLRSVLQIQVSLWPDTDFAQFADLITDILHFRSICQMIHDYTTQTTGGRKKSEALDEWSAAWEYERTEIETRLAKLPDSVQKMVSTAARSFLMDTRSDQKIDQLEKITQGLKIVVGEIAYNPRLQRVFRTSQLPILDLKKFLNPVEDRPARVLVLVTGNQPAGKLFGKLFLVTLKMMALRRKGDENTRRPVYLYVDEFAVYGTEAYAEMFSQARKYRVGQMVAYQVRAQLLDVSKKFQDVVEGSCRNKVYFPAPSPEDAGFLEKSLGSLAKVRETHSENRLGFFGFDNRTLDRKVSRTETVDPRFRLENILYGLQANEAIFVMTEQNQAKAPVVGQTSYATDWLKQNAPTRSKPKRRPRQSTSEKPTQTNTFDRVSIAALREAAATASEDAPNASCAPLPSPNRGETQATPTSKVPSVPSKKDETPTATPPSLVGTAERVKRTHLHKRAMEVTPGTNPICPACGQPLRLEERETKQKWVCPACGFERKKR
ncbi:type IV secretory system conjugative DNA transfer family protein [Alicyclobacillus sp. SP_1]|uniref:type IV secretory system conjugative DNA transfer family protein n=1 Tax=Alicyclobacillus sp. SP_1 TaxID=2942475 RepID=UPI00215788B4|nr:TraM recognition domain-containing protein [Alicyclobacillus sp. SP_1]